MACSHWGEPPSSIKSAHDVIRSMVQRECSLGKSRRRDRSLHLAECFLRRFKFSVPLRGHRGCVNRLCWNESGSLLASVSDDTRIILWTYPKWSERCPDNEPRVVVPTEHRSNIFGVKFLPCSGDTHLVTGAMDASVQLHSLERISRNHNVHTTSMNVHTDRVKAVDVEPLNPHNFWSASEDGTVRQFDSRALRDSSVLFACRDETDRAIEIKFLSINPVRTHQVALACGDPFVRVYDRRMPGAPFLLLCPAHMCLHRSAGRRTSHHTTCVSWGVSGRRLAASYHGDGCYTFNVEAGTVAASLGAEGGRAQRTRVRTAATDKDYYDNLVRRNVFLYDPHGSNPAEITCAIQLLTKGLGMFPSSGVLLRARAEALLSRKWRGDAAFALYDIEKALDLSAKDKEEWDISHPYNLSLAYIKALHQLGQDESASHMIQKLVKEYGNGDDLSDDDRYVSLKASVERKMAERRRWNSSEAQTQPGDDSDDEDEDEDQPPRSSSGAGDDPEVLANVRRPGSLTQLWQREGPRRVLTRFIGHSNNQTDTKEVTFLGNSDGVVASGSDDGNVHMYDADSGRLLHYLEADTDIVNCVQCHPCRPVLATSGLENEVKLWEPGPSLESLDFYEAGSLGQMRTFASEDTRVLMKSRMMDMVVRNQEANNETYVRPLFSGADLYNENHRVVFRALASRFGMHFQEEGEDAQCTTV